MLHFVAKNKMAARNLDTASHASEPKRDKKEDDMSFPYPKMFISISGLIGAGKTTLAEELAKEMGFPVYYEPVEDNIYLEDFYKDMKTYGFPMQVYLLNRRYQQHQQIIWSGDGAVQDRSIYEDAVFARILVKQGNMSKRDYKTYTDLYNNMSKYLTHPNFLIHLDVTPEESLERIKQRSRGCEAGIPLSYLQDLYDEYNIFLAEISKRIPVIRIRWANYRSAKELAMRVYAEMKKHQAIVDIPFDGTMTTAIPQSASNFY